jgi:putative alpha-1,2-mannosidase
MSSIGLFAVDGLTSPDPAFSIGSPLFEKVTIKLNPQYYKGEEFVITTKDSNPKKSRSRKNEGKSIYVEPLKTIDGKESTAGSIKFADVVDGGSMELTLTKTSPAEKK